MCRDGSSELVIRDEHTWLAFRRQGHSWPLQPRAFGYKAEVWLDRHASLWLAGASAVAARGARAWTHSNFTTNALQTYPLAQPVTGRYVLAEFINTTDTNTFRNLGGREFVVNAVAVREPTIGGLAATAVALVALAGGRGALIPPCRLRRSAF
jgi:hypothetical protein